MRATTPSRRRAIIVGGSLGGLNAGVWLMKAGFAVDIFERASSPLADRGTGIVLHPATARYVSAHGGMDLRDISVAAHRFRYLGLDGSCPFEASSHYRFSSYGRLYRTLLECCGRTWYHLGEECIDCEQDESRVVVSFKSGRVESCDVVVFADGINSTGRRHFLPDVAPRFAGYIAWRGTVRPQELSRDGLSALEGAITYSLLSDSHALSYPIPGPAGAEEPERPLINWLWYRNIAPDDSLRELVLGAENGRFSASLPVDRIPDSRLREVRADSRALPPAISEMIARTEHPFIQIVFDLEVPRMVFGRICLLGDAAFTARPHAAAGTAKAAENAWALGEAMTAFGGDVVPALEHWETGQLALGRHLVTRSREAGQRLQSGHWQVGEPLSFGLYAAGDSTFDER